MELAAIPVIETPSERMLCHSYMDEKGAAVIISVRAEIYDEALALAALRMLAVPPHPA
jgi:hypothetical protein